MSGKRFKTKKELIEEYGQNWRNKTAIIYAMDYLLGLPVEKSEGWAITQEAITQEAITDIEYICEIHAGKLVYRGFKK